MRPAPSRLPAALISTWTATVVAGCPESSSEDEQMRGISACPYPDAGSESPVVERRLVLGGVSRDRGFNLDGLFDSDGPSVEGCGIVDGRSGGDVAFGSFVDASEPVFELEAALVAAYGPGSSASGRSLTLRLRELELDPRGDDPCVRADLVVVGPSGIHEVHGGGSVQGGRASLVFTGALGLGVSITPQPAACVAQACSSAELVLAVQDPVLAIDVSPETVTDAEFGLFGGAVVASIGPRVTTPEGLLGFDEALTAFGDASGLRDDALQLVERAFRSNRDLRVESTYARCAAGRLANASGFAFSAVVAP